MFAVLQSKYSFYLYQLKLLKNAQLKRFIAKNRKTPIAVQTQGFGLQ